MDNCVMCGAELPTECGKQYCGECEEILNKPIKSSTDIFEKVKLTGHYMIFSQIFERKKENEKNN